MPRDPRPASVLALVALAAVLCFAATALSVHGLRPELAWVDAQMSVYLVGPWAGMLRAGYVALAIGILTLGIGLYREPPHPRRSAAPLLMFAVAAASLVVTAFAPMRFPDEEQRLVHLVHGTSAQAAFLCATTGMSLQAWRLRQAHDWQRIAPVLLGWALACFTGVWVLALFRDLPRGLSQKALVAAIVLWFGFVAWRLWREASRRHRTMGETPQICC